MRRKVLSEDKSKIMKNTTKVSYLTIRKRSTRLC